MKLFFSAKNCSAGYTMVEILLVMATITVLAGLSMPVYHTFQIKNYLDLGMGNTAQALRRAQLLSQAVDSDSNWGVKVQSGQIIMFKGANFASRDTAYDEITELPESIIPSGNTEFVYEKISGKPQAAGDLLLTSTRGEQETLAVNAKGMVEY